MAINRHNYEEKLIDFLEGHLPEAERGDLFLFLEANHDIRDEFDSLRSELPIVASDPVIGFPQKEKLIRRQVGLEYIDEFSWLCIAKVSLPRSNEKETTSICLANAGLSFKNSVKNNCSSLQLGHQVPEIVNTFIFWSNIGEGKVISLPSELVFVKRTAAPLCLAMSNEWGLPKRKLGSL